MKHTTARWEADEKRRCGWCLGDAVYVDYHDHEWCVPLHDDRRLFEMLILEGAQAGLSWITILKRRHAYTNAYADWDVTKVARFGEKQQAFLLSEKSGIIRNRLKVKASINNARAFIDVQEEFGSFDQYLWRFTDGEIIIPQQAPVVLEDVPCETPLSKTISKDLKQRGFSFVGPVIIYSYMQACGLVNDHLRDCFLSPHLA